MPSLYRYDTYEEMIGDPKWRKRLRALNMALLDSMSGFDGERSINGNIFYARQDPGFVDLDLAERFEAKRRNLFSLSRQISTLLEVGVNGGHSLFLALSANPALRVIGIDVAERLQDSWAPVDLYVPAAFDWLTAEFPDRCTFIKGNSLVELPRYVIENPDATIDAVHLDGSKDTHLRELLAILPLMKKGGFVIFDDANTRPVSRGIAQVMALNIARPRDLSHLGLARTPGHKIFPILDARG